MLSLRQDKGINSTSTEGGSMGGGSTKARVDESTLYLETGRWCKEKKCLW
nr:hypothetical protein [Tanacetum cinerariifolium]